MTAPTPENIQSYLESKLKVGARIRIGKKSAEKIIFESGEVIDLIEGYFEHDNGLYTETHIAPSVKLAGEYESIYHIFGNDLEDFLDSEILEGGE